MIGVVMFKGVAVVQLEATQEPLWLSLAERDFREGRDCAGCKC